MQLLGLIRHWSEAPDEPPDEHPDTIAITNRDAPS